MVFARGRHQALSAMIQKEVLHKPGQPVVLPEVTISNSIMQKVHTTFADTNGKHCRAIVDRTEQSKYLPSSSEHAIR